MKDVKYRWNTLCLYDYRGVEEHLSAMAARGWRLEKAGNSLWKYRRAKPASLRYAVTYNAGASQFNPGPTEGQESLEELCAAAGWEKVSDWAQAQIFSTGDPSAVPLETDEALRLENIHRSMRKNFLPANIALLAIGLLMASSLVYSLVSGHVLRRFASNAHLLSGTMFLFVALLEAYTLFHYYGWRRRSRRSIEESGSCFPINTRAYQRLNRTGLFLVGFLLTAYLLAELFSGNRGMALFYVVYLTLFVLLVFLVRRTTLQLRKWKASKGVNMAVTLAVDVVLAFALVGGLTFGAIRFGWFSGGSGETYTYQNVHFDVHPREDLPLTLSDLTGKNYRHIHRERRREGSFLLSKWSCREMVLENSREENVWPGSLHLSYTVYVPRFQWVYGNVVDELLGDAAPRPSYGMAYAYLPEDPAPWGAGEVYRLWRESEPSNSWLLCFPGRVVSLSMDWEPTAAEKALVQSRLEPEA